MDKVTVDIAKVTHVIVNGKEYERFDIKSGGNPEGRAILIGLACTSQSNSYVPKGKSEGDRVTTPFWCQIGTKFGGQRYIDNSLSVYFNPVGIDKTPANNNTQFAL